MRSIQKILGLGLFLLTATLTVSSCNSPQGSDGEATQVETQEQHAQVFSCPMKCEGDKTYAQAGTCPECKMDLEAVGDAHGDHNHGAHNHGEESHGEESHDHGDHEHSEEGH